MNVAISVILALGLVGADKPKVAVFGFQGVGIDSVTAVVATSIFRSELGATGKFDVATADEVIDALGEDKVVTRISEARDAGMQIEASKVVIGSLSKLGTQTIGKAQLVNVISGDVEFEDQLATTSQDELDIVLRRLAKALATRQRAGDRVELGDVTEKESKEATRRQAFFGGGVGLGGFLPIASLGKSDMLMSVTGLGLYETPDFFAELRYTGNLSFSSTTFEAASYNPFTIGVFKTASREDFTPYYGGALGIGFYSFYKDGYRSDYQSGQGFVLAPGAGYMLFHTYDFHVMADIRYHVLFGGGGVQHGPAFSVNLVYRRSQGSRGCCGIGGWW